MKHEIRKRKNVEGGNEENVSCEMGWLSGPIAIGRSHYVVGEEVGKEACVENAKLCVSSMTLGEVSKELKK